MKTLTVTITTDGTGNGRAKNPYVEFKKDIFGDDIKCHEGLLFNEANPPMPVFKDGVPFLQSGEFEAVVKWQYEPQDEDYLEWRDCDESFYNAIKRGNERYPDVQVPTRQIFEIITPQVGGDGKKGLTMDRFFELGTFSDVPIVNKYFKDIKVIYHSGEITSAIERFAIWHANLERTARIKSRDEKGITTIDTTDDVCPTCNNLIGSEVGKYCSDAVHLPTNESKTVEELAKQNAIDMYRCYPFPNDNYTYEAMRNAYSNGFIAGHTAATSSENNMVFKRLPIRKGVFKG